MPCLPVKMIAPARRTRNVCVRREQPNQPDDAISLTVTIPPMIPVTNNQSEKFPQHREVLVARSETRASEWNSSWKSRFTGVVVVRTIDTRDNGDFTLDLAHATRRVLPVSLPIRQGACIVRSCVRLTPCHPYERTCFPIKVGPKSASHTYLCQEKCDEDLFWGDYDQQRSTTDIIQVFPV